MNPEASSQWNLAVSAYRAGRLKQASALAKAILASSPANIDALHLLSLIAYGDGNTDSELGYLDQILEIAPNHVEALNGKAAILRNRGKSADAIPLCLQALRIRPNYVNALNTLGLCYQQGGEAAEAAKCFRKVIALQPGLAAAHLNLGAALERLGNSADATKCYRRAAAIAPGTPEAFESLGYLQLQERKREEAAVSFGKALELRPNSAKMLILLAEVKSELGLIEEPIELLRRALAIDPESGKASSLLGLKLQALGEFDEAADAFQRSLVCEPVQGEAYLGLFIGRKAQEEDRPLVAQMVSCLGAKKLSPYERMQLNKALGKALDDLGEYGPAISHMDESNRIALEEIKDVTSNFDRNSLRTLLTDIKRTYTNELFASNRALSIPAQMPVLIVGMPRSGTTLMEQILSSHSKVGAGGELRFWADAHASGRSSFSAIVDKPGKAKPLADNYLCLLKSKGAKARYVTDKMPDNFFHMGVIHLLLPNARFIHCRRNALDNGVSLYMTPFPTRPPFCYRREDIVFYYRAYREFFDHWHSVLPEDRILDVDYEEVVSNTESQVRRVLDFLGLEWEDACLSPQANKRIVNTPSRWQTRQAVYKTSMERWRRYEPWLGVLEELKPE